MIIGITGTIGSGKDTAAAFFIKQEFVHYSLSRIIDDELQKEGKELTRLNRQEKGNSLRKQFGNGILAIRTITKMEDGKNYLVTSIRNREEIEQLKKTSKSFFLLNINAEPLLRFQRTQERKTSVIDPKDFEEFLANDKKESVSADGSGQEISKCAELADFTVLNNGGLEEFHNQLAQRLAELQKQMAYKRPNWDEYFINIMEEISKRSTCDRGRMGALVVKDKRILTTGYSGSPIGLPHCDEVGHMIVDVIDESGTTRKHCIRTTHAEQNAMIQAARFGISIDGATVYCRTEPCHVCAKMIINAGIKRVVCKKRYHAAQVTRDILKDANVNLDVLDDSIEEYKNQ